MHRAGFDLSSLKQQSDNNLIQINGTQMKKIEGSKLNFLHK
jgi:hypothetical protein